MGTGLLLVVLLVAVIAGVIAITQAQRKIPVQYASRMVGRKMYPGGTNYMPLQGQLFGRHADHFCLLDSDVPEHGPAAAWRRVVKTAVFAG